MDSMHNPITFIQMINQIKKKIKMQQKKKTKKLKSTKLALMPMNTNHKERK